VPEKKVAAKPPVAKPVAKTTVAKPAAKPLAKATVVKPTPDEETPMPAAPLPAGMSNIAGELVTPVDLSTPGQKTKMAEKPAKTPSARQASPQSPHAIAAAKTPQPAAKVSAPEPAMASDSAKPLKATLHADGMVVFRGHTLSTPDFETKLKEVMASKPHKTLLLHASNDVPFASIKELIDAGKEAGLQEVKLVPDMKPGADASAASTAPAPAAPAPTMKTEALMVPRPVVPPPAKPMMATVPDAPAEDTAAASTAPVPAGPISPVKNDTVP
jgi:biopolymer transport protein ExbD